MIITTTNQYAKINYGKETFVYPLNTISYSVNENQSGVTLFRNKEAIGTEPMNQVTVDGTTLNEGNIDILLSKLFISQSTGGSQSNCTEYIAGENINFTTNIDSTVTISATGDISPNIYYITHYTNLPQDAKIGELGYVTSDGSSAGELTEIYEYDGFDWALKSFKPNLCLRNKGSYGNWMVSEPMDNEYKLYLRSRDSIYDRYRIIAATPNKPVNLYTHSTIYGFPKIFEQDENYRISDFNLYLTEVDSVISNLKHDTSLSINQNYDENINIEKSLLIENCNISNLYIYDNNIKDITINNIDRETPSDYPLSIYISNPSNSISINNIKVPTSLNIEFGSQATDIVYGSKIWNISNVELQEHGLMISSLYDQSDRNNHTSEIINLSNIKLRAPLSITDAWISELNISQVEMIIPDRVEYKEINIYSVYFLDQSTCDKVYTCLGSLLSSGDHFTIGIDTYSEHAAYNLTPSQSVQDEIRSRGIILSIEN